MTTAGRVRRGARRAVSNAPDRVAGDGDGAGAEPPEHRREQRGSSVPRPSSQARGRWPAPTRSTTSRSPNTTRISWETASFGCIIRRRARVGADEEGVTLSPTPMAQGAHSTWKTDDRGRVTGHAEWRPNPRNPSGFDQAKRVDTQYANPHTHHNKVTREQIPTPHVHDKAAPGDVRPATLDELPR